MPIPETAAVLQVITLVRAGIVPLAQGIALVVKQMQNEPWTPQEKQAIDAKFQKNRARIEELFGPKK